MARFIRILSAEARESDDGLEHRTERLDTGGPRGVFRPDLAGQSAKGTPTLVELYYNLLK